MENPKVIFLMEQNYATLFSLANKLQVKGDQYLKDLTSRQLMTLLAIGHLPEEEASLNNIARMLSISKQSAKQLVSLLEKKGFVIIVPSQQDKRAVNVTITQSGYHAVIENGQLGLQFFNNLFHEFSLEEMETLWNLLKKLYRFDGEEQDGFEEEIDFNPSGGL
jgi:DNA-binding MarR family transcriptional regulator